VSTSISTTGATAQTAAGQKLNATLNKTTQFKAVEFKAQAIAANIERQSAPCSQRSEDQDGSVGANQSSNTRPT
jgi:hypothetical protein